MTRRLLVLVALAAVVLAGCTGGPGADATPEPTATGTPTAGDGGTNAVSAEEIPGVSDGTLTNATALARANQELLSETGAKIQMRHRPGVRADCQRRLRLPLAGLAHLYLRSGLGQ